MAAGDFSLSQIPILKDTASNLWADSRANNQRELFDPETEAIRALMANDTLSAFKRNVALPDNCLGVEVDWLEFNPTATLDSAFTDHQVVPCDITGDKAESKAQTYKMQRQTQTSFSIDETQCQNLFSFADKYAYQSLQADRALVRSLTSNLLNRLHGYAGRNVMPTTDPNNIGTITTGQETLTKINSANMKWQDYYPYLGMVKAFNRLQNPFLLDGTVFMRQRYLAGMQKGTLSDTGGDAAFKAERYYSDPISFQEAGISQRLFYISQGAIAFATGARNPMQANTYQTNTGPVIRYQEPVHGLVWPNGQSVMKDVFAKQSTVTVSGNKCKLVRAFQFELIYDMFLNPKLTTDNVTGVLEFAIDDTVAAVDLD
jgi:hypothetical protein